MAALVLLSGAAAGADDGLGRVHSFKDWVVGCDNTRQCEAQGYAAEVDGVPSREMAALIATRVAGPHQPVRLRIAFSNYEADGAVPRPGEMVNLQAGNLRIAMTVQTGDRAGAVVPPQQVTPQQVTPLMEWLLKGDRIRLWAGKRQWSVSLAGATAALLKMDELQGRVDTPGALVRKGQQPEVAVPAPPLPLVQPLLVPPTTLKDRQLEPHVRAALPRSDKDCPDFDPKEALDDPVRLTATAVLVSQTCFRGAYQSSSRLWQVDDQPPYRARALMLPSPDEAGDDTLVMQSLDQASGRLTVREAAKGRGVGDCWTTREWVWTRSGFALVSADESACKAFDAGGLPITLWRSRTR